MTRIVTDHEMDRRKAMSKAQESLTNAMAEHRLTALEWACEERDRLRQQVQDFMIDQQVRKMETGL